MSSVKKKQLAPSERARLALGHAMLEKGLTDAVRQRLRRDAPFSLVIVAPSVKHLSIIEDALGNLTLHRASILRMDDPDRRDFNDFLAKMSDGLPVVALCSDMEQISPTFRELADQVVRMPSHTTVMLRKTIAHVLGTGAPRLPADFRLHPDPELLCNCILPGRTADEILASLSGLWKPAPQDGLPDLEEAVEFGEARTWGLRVGVDLDAWRAGTLDAADLDNNLLLVSPPGLGKTFFARTLASHLAVELREIKFGDWLAAGGHLGEVIAQMRASFDEAAAAAPAVVLLDELDSIGRRDRPDQSSTFKNGVVNELLTILDGAERRHPGLVVIAATNEPDGIDPALLRPGRLGCVIELALPDAAGIRNILRHHLREDLKDVPLDEVARRCVGLSPAELMDLVRKARQGARGQTRPLEVADLLALTDEPPAIDWLRAGQIAMHEAGHAMACILLEKAPVLHSVRILEDGLVGGCTASSRLPGVTTRSHMEGRVMVELAGRVAEDLIYGKDDTSDGSAQDLANATALLCRLHGSYGMGSTLVSHADPVAVMTTDKAFGSFIEAELVRLKAVVEEEFRGREIYLQAIALRLLKDRTLSGPEVVRIIQETEERMLLAGAKPADVVAH